MESKHAFVLSVLAVALAGGCASSDPNTKTSGATGQPLAGMGSPIPGGIAGSTAAPPPLGTSSTPGMPLPKGTAGSAAPTTGSAGTGSVAMNGNMGSMAGSVAVPMAGSTGAAGSADPGAAGSAPVMMGSGDCCPDGNCLCHGDLPADLTSKAGPFKTATVDMQTGTGYYPTDAEPPFAAIAICPGFLYVGREMGVWVPFFASWG